MEPCGSNRSFQRNDCRLCGANEPEVAVKLVPTPPGDHYVPASQLGERQGTYPLDLVLCCRCGHLQLRDVVDPDLLYRRYIYRTEVSSGLAEHYQQYAYKILRTVSPPDGALVVDIGSNDGTLLRCFSSRGFRVLGIDPAHDLAEKVTRTGIETLPTYFNAELAREIKRERGPVTILTANNVIANIDRMDDVLDGVRSALAWDGVFVFETGYAADLVQQNLLDNIYHEHLSYFYVKPLERFFREAGLELIDVEHMPTKGGSIRGMVQLAGGPRAASSTVSDLVSYEEGQGLRCAEALRNFGASCEKLRAELASVTHDIVSRGRTVAGYGASVGVTTLLYYFDIGEVVRFLVDDNPARHGLYSPGHHIPVKSPQALYGEKPDYVIIFAWRYAIQIMSKHKEFLEHGGHFVVPLPKLEIID